MKKNRMMRLASSLLVAVLLTTSVISGTFAKYTTKASSQDSARVAKWGVVVTADFSKLFNDAYQDGMVNYVTDETGSDITVQAETPDDDVVAPGTYGVLADFGVTGKPEVDVAVTYVADLKLENWAITSGEYCPIVIQVNGTNYYIGQTIGGVKIETVAALEEAVESAIGNSKATYDTNTDLSNVVYKDLEVSWHWMFEGADRPNNNDYQTDGKDTELGNWSAKGKAMPKISLNIECSITQID